LHVLAFTIALLLATDATAIADARGDWVGVVAAGDKSLRLSAHLERRGQGLIGVIDSPDQGAFGLPLANIVQDGAKLSFDAPSVNARYEAHWDSARNAYVGRWVQGGQAIDLALARGGYPHDFDLDWNAPADPGLAYVPAKRAKPRVGPDLNVGKCVNLSNMLDAPTEGAWGPAFADDDFAIIKAAGFSSVRIPVAFSAHADTAPPYAIDPAFLARVRHAVTLASAAKLNVLLDMHHYDAMMRDPDAEAPRFFALWRQVAQAFADAPSSVWFELLNEPNDKLTNDRLGALYAPALAAIRATNPKRPVIVGPEWNNLDKMLAFEMPDDPYVAPSFHYYDPFLFTHQGAPWPKPAPPMGRSFGSAADRSELDRNVAKVRDYMARTGRVPILGEYGAQDDPRVPLAQRVRYYGAVSSAFAFVGVASCAWGYRSGFRIREGDHWLPGIVEAIRAPKP
jgi:endoglucanase